MKESTTALEKTLVQRGENESLNKSLGIKGRGYLSISDIVNLSLVKSGIISECELEARLKHTLKRF